MKSFIVSLSSFIIHLPYSELIRIMVSMKDKYPPGTVIQILEEWNEGDRSYYVVVAGDEGRGRVDIIPTVADGPLIPRERIRTELFRVIAYCDAKGNLELVGPEIGGTKLSLAGKAILPEGQASK
jgi:acetaldehyde dehydrogenase (acetylating)